MVVAGGVAVGVVVAAGAGAVPVPAFGAFSAIKAPPASTRIPQRLRQFEKAPAPHLEGCPIPRVRWQSAMTIHHDSRLATSSLSAVEHYLRRRFGKVIAGAATSSSMQYWLPSAT